MWFGAPFILKIGPTVFDFYFLFCIATYKIIKQTKGAMIIFSCEETKIELGLKPFLPFRANNKRRFTEVNLRKTTNQWKMSFGRRGTEDIFFKFGKKRGGYFFIILNKNNVFCFIFLPYSAEDDILKKTWKMDFWVFFCLNQLNFNFRFV